MSKNPKNLVGYCGLYCGACGIHRGRIKQAVENLQDAIRAYGFDKMSSELAKWEPSLEHYEEFEQVMNGLTKLFGECPGCAEGGGDPTCEIRICCKQKSYTICVECPEMDTCKKLAQRDWAIKNLKTIKATGVKNWLTDVQKKVKSGYCYLDEKKG